MYDLDHVLRHSLPSIGITDAVIEAYKVFAKWADDGSLWRTFVASVAHLSPEKHLGVSAQSGTAGCRSCTLKD
jgi:hypothetical protein